MKEQLEILITETTNLAREYGHKPKVVRRGRSLRSRPPSAIVVCEQCSSTADLMITFSNKAARQGILTKVSCIVATNEIQIGNDNMAETVTKEIAMNAKHGDIFHSKTLKQGPKGARVPLRVRVTGKCQTWKRSPNDFRLPVKFGLYEHWAIDQNNCNDWEKP